MVELSMIYKELTGKKVIIYGAGSAGRLVLGQLRQVGVFVSGFVDDDAELIGHTIDGVAVYGPSSQSIAEILDISSVFLIAIPSVSAHRMQTIGGLLSSFLRPVYRMPTMSDLLVLNSESADSAEIPLHKLLGREEIKAERSEEDGMLHSQSVLITGAGGSIGSELVRQVATEGPRRIVLVDSSEIALYLMEEELAKDTAYANIEIVYSLGSVLDRGYIEELFAIHRPEHVFHAAAYKHVPLVQNNPIEGIRNNVLGTLNLVKVASGYELKSFCLISTDKAVRPTNYMGASKRVAELVVKHFGHLAQGDAVRTCYNTVRFGNVLGSSGSVVPLFNRQIRSGGPVTVTDERVTRYFMTIPEAVSLVLESNRYAKGGEVFLLDMGAPVLITDLAKKMIALSGYKPTFSADKKDGEIEIVFTGLRPGEKLYEELLVDGKPEETPHPKLFKAHDSKIDFSFEESCLELMDALGARDISRIDRLLAVVVEGFNISKMAVEY
ncbi:polysaccharide biosynthesis protein [Pseudomonadales bacterium]|nr:polysaccharide biosynthesis protein [Pseudomonadales bacterium]